MKYAALTMLIIMAAIFTIVRAFAQENVLTIVTAQQNSNVRASASSQSERVGVLNRGESALLLSENPDGENIAGITLWYQVRLINNVEGWVWSGAVSIAQITPTPSPTALPTLPPGYKVQGFETDNIPFLEAVDERAEAGRGNPQRIAWSPDGAQVLVGTAQGIWLHDVATQHSRQVASLAENTWSVFRLGFIPNTTSIFYVINEEGSVAVFIDNLATDSRPRKIRIQGEAPQGFASEYRNAFLSPDGRTMALVGNQIRLIHLIADSPDANIKDEPLANIRPEYRVGTLAFHPDSSHFAVIGHNSSGFHIEAYRTQDQSRLYRHSVTSSSARFMFFHPDGKQVTVVGDFMKFFNFDLATGTKSREYEATGFYIQDAQLSPDGLHLAIALGGNELLLYDTRSAEQIASLPDYAAPHSIAFSPDGHQLASVSSSFSGSVGGYMRLSDLATNTTHYSELFQANGAHFDRSGRRIYLRVAERFNLYGADNLGGEALRTTLLPSWATLAVPSADDTRFYLAGTVWEQGTSSGRIQVLDAQSSAPVTDIISLDPIRNLWAHPNNQAFMLLLEDGDISVYDEQTLTELARFSHPQSDITHLSFAGDGQTFVTAGSGPSVALWQGDNQRLHLLDIPTQYRGDDFQGLTALAINVDGSLVAAATPNATFFWHGLTGTFLRQLPVGVTDLAIHPDGRTAILMAGLHGVLFYDVPSDTLYDTSLLGGASSIEINASGSLFLVGGESLALWGIPQIISTSPYETRVLFEDDFERRNARRWEGFQGNPVIEEAGNHVLSIDNSSADYIAIAPKANPNAGNLILEARLRVVRSADQAAAPQFDFMFLQPDIGVGIYNMRQTMWTANVFSRAGNSPYGFGIIAFHPPTDEWLNLRLELYRDESEGNVIKVFVNGRLVQQSQHVEGRWGEFTFSIPPSSAIQLDDVRIMEAVAPAPPSPTPTATLSPTATASPSATVTLTPTATVTLSPTPSPSATAQPGIRFHDDFEDGDLTGWDTTFAGDGVALVAQDDNTVLHITGAQDDFISLGFSGGLDAATALEARMQVIDLGPNNGSIVFNLMSENPGHASGYSALVSTGGAAFLDRNDNFKDLEPDMRQDFQIELNRWYHIRFEATEGALRLFVDGVPVQSAEVAVIHAGQPVLIFDQGMEVYLDDVQVECLTCAPE